MTIVPRIRFITIAAASVALAGSLAPAQAAPTVTSSGLGAVNAVSPPSRTDLTTDSPDRSAA